MRYYFWGDVTILAIIVSLIVSLIVGTIWLLNMYSQYQCSNFGETTGQETKYMPFDACYVNTAAGWQRWDEYIARATASEGLE